MQATPEKLAKERFTEFLRDGNYRITAERFEVLARVMRYNEHFDAESLFLGLRADSSKVSRATVYKTLALLHCCGLVSRYMFAPGDVAQYEKTIDRPGHDHMVCSRCGTITEFPNGSVRYLVKQICYHHDFQESNHSLQIFGICSNCRRSRRTAPHDESSPAKLTAIPRSVGRTEKQTHKKKHEPADR